MYTLSGLYQIIALCICYYPKTIAYRVLYFLKFAFIFKVLTHIIKCFSDQDSTSILV